MKNNKDASKVVFFYGLFMDQNLLKTQGLKPFAPFKAMVRGYGLRIGERATLVPAAGEQVHGVVMNLSESELEQLYSHSSVSDYVPTTLKATNEAGVSREVSAYVLPPNQLTGQNTDYATQLLLLAESLGFPNSYLQAIARFCQP